MKTKVILYCRGRLTDKPYTETRPCKTIEEAKQIADNHLTAKGAEFKNGSTKVQIK